MVIIRSLEHDVAQAVVLGLKIVNKRTCLTSRFFIYCDLLSDIFRIKQLMRQTVIARKISFISLIHFRDEYMSPQNNHLQRPPAAVLYAVELAKLKQNDNAPCPPGWQLSLPAARAFILGDEAQNISRKVVISPSAVERMLVTLATGRGLMLVGEPGTAKSLLSELLATAISGDAGLTIQGGASTTEDQIKYGWNYALLINHGPSTEALVPAPLY